MTKSNGCSERVYTTDAYQAGFLTLKGHFPELIEERNKIVFAFVLTDGLLKSLSDYSNGALIEASKFAFNKLLLNRLFLKTN
jgi:hypothetical protein